MAATLTDEARKLGQAYIERLLRQWGASYDDRKDLLAQNTTLKSCAVVRLRRRLVRILRDTCWQDHPRFPDLFLIDETEFGGEWYHLSTTNIADLLHLDHSTVVGILKRDETERKIMQGLKGTRVVMFHPSESPLRLTACASEV